jgi:hypothetical protein
MFGFSSFSQTPFSTLPGGTVVVLRSVPIEIRAGEVIVLNNLPVEIIGEKSVPLSLKWVLSSRGSDWEIDAQNLKWDIK